MKQTQTIKNPILMKALFIHYAQCTSKYQRYPQGWQFIETIDETHEAYNLVQNREDQDFFPVDDKAADNFGKVYTSSGGEVYDPAEPREFYFGDHTYHVVDLCDIPVESPQRDAIENDQPWNIIMIRREIGFQNPETYQGDE